MQSGLIPLAAGFESVPGSQKIIGPLPGPFIFWLPVDGEADREFIPSETREVRPLSSFKYRFEDHYA